MSYKPNKHQKTKDKGYTIVETMIVLVVSVALFASVVGVYSVQNRRTQFNESVQTFQLKLQDIINDVETGYYPTNNNINCEVDGAGNVQVAPGTNQQGTNEDCVFAGKAIQMDGSTYEAFTLVGKRTATSINDADLKSVNFEIEDNFLSNGLEVRRVVAKSDLSLDLDGFSLLPNFGASSSSGVANKASLAVLRDGGVNRLNTATNISSADIARASQGITLCLTDNPTSPDDGRKALIILGTTNIGDPQVIIDPGSQWQDEGCND